MKKFLYTILIILIIIFITLLYARFIGTTGLIIKEYPYKNNNIPDNYNGLKIVQFSDIHYKKIITKKEIKNIVKEINKLKPDIVIFTGDLIDKNTNLKSNDIKFLINALSNIEAKYGTYAIYGDNDYLLSDTIKNIYIQSNFTLLDNSYTIIHNEHNEKIFIGGLSTSTYEEASIDTVMDYFKSNNNLFKIILIHEPDYIEEILNKYNNIDLILAGHSLNGSINIPIIKNIILPNGAKKYYKPHYHKNNTDIYISSGLGLNNINFRLFNHPSINFYRLNKTN